MGNLPTWPPEGEPATSAAVVGQLDAIGWTADRTAVLEYTAGHALISWDDQVNPPMWAIVDLVDGHRVAGYGTEASARAAFAPYMNRRQSR